LKVSLVCKKELDGVTVKRDYPFIFDTTHSDTDGYIVMDEGMEHWMELPSNSHRIPDGEWKSSDYFSEVVTDPES
jgi:hypothetical protein